MYSEDTGSLEIQGFTAVPPKTQTSHTYVEGIKVAKDHATRRNSHSFEENPKRPIKPESVTIKDP